MIDLKRWFDEVEHDDELFDALLAALACAIHDKLVEEGVEKAKRDLSHLVPVKKFRVHPRGGVHAATYYINPEKVKPKGEVPHRTQVAAKHVEELRAWAEGMAKYHERRAQFYESGDAREFANQLAQKLKEGSVRLGGEVERFLEQWGMKYERPSLSSPLNEPFMHFVFGVTYTHQTPTPEFHDLRDRVMSLLEESHMKVNKMAQMYDDLIKGWGQEAAEVRAQKRAKNLAVANALTYNPEMGEQLRGLLRAIFAERGKIVKAQWSALTAAWSVWTGHPVNAEVENKLRAYLDASRRKESVWRRYLEHQVLGWELGSRAVKRLQDEGVDVSKLTEQQLRDEIEKEWKTLNPDAKVGFYEQQRNLLKELNTRRTALFKKALDLYDLFADGIAKVNPAYKDSLEQIKRVGDQIRKEMNDELRLRLKIVARRQLGHDTTSLEEDLACTQRVISALKELHSQLVGSMLVHSATQGEIPMPHWAVISGALHNILKTRYEHKEKRAWQWEMLAGVKDYITEVLGRDVAREVRAYNDAYRAFVRQHPAAPETVIKFLANVFTGGRLNKLMAAAYREFAENPSFADATKAVIASKLLFSHFTL